MFAATQYMLRLVNQLNSVCDRWVLIFSGCHGLILMLVDTPWFEVKTGKLRGQLLYDSAAFDNTNFVLS